MTDIDYRFTDHIERAIEFSKHTFGPGKRTLGLVKHIQKELEEIQEQPDDLEEWIDIIVLGIDGAWRHCPPRMSNEDMAVLIAQTLAAKQIKNENRTWPDWRDGDEDTPIEHDRTQDAKPLCGQDAIGIPDSGRTCPCVLEPGHPAPHRCVHDQTLKV